MSALPSSPAASAAFTAQSVAVSAVASPQPMAMPLPIATPAAVTPASGVVSGAAPANNQKKPSNNGGNRRGPYGDSKQPPKNAVPMPYNQMNAQKSNGPLKGAYAAAPQQPLSFAPGTAAIANPNGAMAPIMFAYGGTLAHAQAAPQQQTVQNVNVPTAGAPAYSYGLPFSSQPVATGAAGAASLPANGAQPSVVQLPLGVGAGVVPGAALPGSAQAIAAAAAEGTLRKVIKVSSKSNVKSVAGAISHTTRAGESPTLMATGSESVNQAVKAISIARGYLAENKLDVSCQPVFRNQEKGAITFVLSKGVLRAKKQGEDDDIQQLRVARGSDPNSVAGSIANKVRNGERVLVQSIGAGSVDITVRAITLARRFLEGDAIDICFRPEFIHVKLEEGERSAIKFTILAQQV